MTEQMICKECGGKFWIGYGQDNGGEDLCDECIERRKLKEIQTPQTPSCTHPHMRVGQG